MCGTGQGCSDARRRGIVRNRRWLLVDGKNRALWDKNRFLVAPEHRLRVVGGMELCVMGRNLFWPMIWPDGG